MTDDQKYQLRPFDWSAAREVSRRNLPHLRQDGVIYFITFRLADALPAQNLLAWRAERDAWLKNNPLPHTTAQHRQAVLLWDQRINKWLDAGHGSCCLRNPEAGAIVEATLRHFDGSRYLLGDYVVMPNHVHAMVAEREGWLLTRIQHSWKSYTAHQINALLGRKGRLWQDESFDHIVRSDSDWRKFSKYIAANAQQIPDGVARLRLGCGMLKM